MTCLNPQAICASRQQLNMQEIDKSHMKPNLALINTWTMWQDPNVMHKLYLET